MYLRKFAIEAILEALVIRKAYQSLGKNKKQQRKFEDQIAIWQCEYEVYIKIPGDSHQKSCTKIEYCITIQIKEEKILKENRNMLQIQCCLRLIFGYVCCRSLHWERGLKSHTFDWSKYRPSRSLHWERGLKFLILVILVLFGSVVPCIGNVD